MSLSQWSELRDRIKETISLKDLVEQYTILKPVGNNVWSGHCPHPDHDDRIPSFRLFKNSNGQYTFKCFGCQDIYAKKGQNGNYGTDCFAFLQWMSDYKGSKKVLTFMDTLKILAQQAGLSLPTEEKYADIFKSNEKMASEAQSNLTQQVVDYLYKRGLDDSDIKQWRIGFWNFIEQGITVPRIVFPLFDISKRVIGFSSRIPYTLSKDIPKYKNSQTSPLFQKKSYFYGCHLLDHDISSVIITEGQFDVILSVKQGISAVLATLGTSFSQDHAIFLKQRRLTPIFIYDSDPAGTTATEYAINICNNVSLPSKVCILPQNLDLAEAALLFKDKLASWISDHIIPSWQYLLNDTVIRYEAKLQDLRSNIIPDIRRAMPPDANDRILMKSFVKERFGIIL